MVLRAKWSEVCGAKTPMMQRKGDKSLKEGSIACTNTNTSTNFKVKEGSIACTNTNFKKGTNAFTITNLKEGSIACTNTEDDHPTIIRSIIQRSSNLSEDDHANDG